MAEQLTHASGSQQLLEIRDSSDVAEARRLATRVASGADFSEVEAGNIALVATELATNLLKHANHGRIIVRVLQQSKKAGLELIALDQGPGISDLAQSMRDGYSTAGSPGTGLGAVNRLASEFDIHSLPDKGTAVLARLWFDRTSQPANPEIEFGIVCLPMPGQEVSGDDWRVESLAGKSICTLADGLGHGADAAIAARAAVETALKYRDKAPAEIVERAHGALRSTRGAALAVGEIDPAKKLLRFCGVGNIVAIILTNGGIRHLVSYNGIVGHEARKIAEFTYPWSPDSLLIMHSDGLGTRWDLRTYPALMQRHPALVAGVLFRDFWRGRDDVTVLAARENGFYSQ